MSYAVFHGKEKLKRKIIDVYKTSTIYCNNPFRRWAITPYHLWRNINFWCPFPAWYTCRNRTTHFEAMPCVPKHFSDLVVLEKAYSGVSCRATDRRNIPAKISGHVTHNLRPTQARISFKTYNFHQCTILHLKHKRRAKALLGNEWLPGKTKILPFTTLKQKTNGYSMN